MAEVIDLMAFGAGMAAVLGGLGAYVKLDASGRPDMKDVA